MAETGGIQELVKSYILNEFLEGEDPNNLDPSTELISSGILDSLATLKLITFLEERFGVSIAGHEADEENFGTVAKISELVQSKL